MTKYKNYLFIDWRIAMINLLESGLHEGKEKAEQDLKKHLKALSKAELVSIITNDNVSDAIERKWMRNIKPYLVSTAFNVICDIVYVWR